MIGFSPLYSHDSFKINSTVFHREIYLGVFCRSWGQIKFMKDGIVKGNREEIIVFFTSKFCLFYFFFYLCLHFVFRGGSPFKPTYSIFSVNQLRKYTNLFNSNVLSWKFWFVLSHGGVSLFQFVGLINENFNSFLWGQFLKKSPFKPTFLSIGLSSGILNFMDPRPTILKIRRLGIFTCQRIDFLIIGCLRVVGWVSWLFLSHLLKWIKMVKSVINSKNYRFSVFWMNQLQFPWKISSYSRIIGPFFHVWSPEDPGWSVEKISRFLFLFLFCFFLKCGLNQWL